MVFNLTPVPASGATAAPNPTNSGLVVQGQTLTPGGLVSINNTPVSLPTSGSALIVGSSTIPLGSVETISVGSQALVLSEGASSDLVVNGQTIVPGSAIVVSGVTVSVPTGAMDIVVDDSTTAGLGGAILSDLGFNPSTETTAAPTVAGNGNGNGSVVAFTGNASRMGNWLTWWIGVMAMVGGLFFTFGM